jgi:DhnA family fructose-bisphosphate aldolase class Ia
MAVDKQIRLSRILSHPSERLCPAAVYHFIGDQKDPPKGLTDLRATIMAVVPGKPDAITMHRDRYSEREEPCLEGNL